jgi:hypothetical protein
MDGSHGSRAVARNLVVRPPAPYMTDAMSSPPKIESGKTLDLGRRRGAFPYLLADRRGRPGWMTYSGLVSNHTASPYRGDLGSV